MRDLSSRFGDSFLILVAASFTAAAVVTVVVLHMRADDARQDQVRVGQITAATDSLATVPLVALYASFGQGEQLLRQSESTITQQLVLLPETGSRQQLATIRSSSEAYAAHLWGVLPLLHTFERQSGSTAGALSQLRLLPGYARVQSGLLRDIRVLKSAASATESAYAATAHTRNTESYVGSVLAVLFSCIGFSIVFRSLSRSRREAQALAEENARLLTRSRIEAETDALTGLPNRRKLMADLDDAFAALASGRHIALALYDLDGFKDANDTFGHPAGDRLLARLSRRLDATASPHATAYRMGGDEFCVICQDSDSDETLARCSDALTLSEPGIGINSSTGSVVIPEEARTAEDALRLADQRLYAAKAVARRSRTAIPLPNTRVGMASSNLDLVESVS